MRDRFNARQFISWIQDVDDKYDRMKVRSCIESVHFHVGMSRANLKPDPLYYVSWQHRWCTVGGGMHV